MAETFTNEESFELLPAGDEDLLSADDLLTAAETSLNDDVFAASGSAPAPIPFGKSWAWDHANERYIRAGTAPLEVRGYDALRQWVYAALQTAQGAHPIFSDEFGIEDPEDWIGLVDPSDAVATFEPRAREALLQHERIEEVDEMNPEYDPDEGIVTIADIVVVTDQAEAVPLTAFELTPNY